MPTGDVPPSPRRPETDALRQTHSAHGLPLEGRIVCRGGKRAAAGVAVRLDELMRLAEIARIA
jgi:hypothetical protein